MGEQKLLVLARRPEIKPGAGQEPEWSAEQRTRPAYCVQLGGTHVTGRDILLVDCDSLHVFGKVPDFKQRSLDKDADYLGGRKLYPGQNWVLSDP